MDIDELLGNEASAPTNLVAFDVSPVMSPDQPPVPPPRRMSNVDQDAPWWAKSPTPASAVSTPKSPKAMRSPDLKLSVKSIKDIISAEEDKPWWEQLTSSNNQGSRTGSPKVKPPTQLRSADEHTMCFSFHHHMVFDNFLERHPFLIVDMPFDKISVQVKILNHIFLQVHQRHHCSRGETLVGSRTSHTT